MMRSSPVPRLALRSLTVKCAPASAERASSGAPADVRIAR